MPQPDATTYFILDSRQGTDPLDGWRAEKTSGLRVTGEGLGLAPKPSPPVPLKNEEGTFGGLENPTGVAVAPDGAIYVADSRQHLIFKITRRGGLHAGARFFRVGGEKFAADLFVYVPAANRLERWPGGAAGREPRSFSEVEVICETAWDAGQARKAVLLFAEGKELCPVPRVCSEAEGDECGRRKCECRGRVGKRGESSREGGGGCGCAGCSGAREAAASVISKEWDDLYPSHLPAGELCRSSIEYLRCLGGEGHGPRQFNEPRGLSVSRDGSLYVADSKNHRVQVFGLHGLVLREVWGKLAGEAEAASHAFEGCAPAEEDLIRAGQPVAGDAPGEFREPWDVLADECGNVYVADKGNHRLQKFERRARRFQIIDGKTLGAHFFQALYGPSKRDRFVFVPARQRVERWPHELGHDPADIGEVTTLGEGVADADAARGLVLAALDASGAADMLVEWDAAYPDALAAFPQPEPPFSSPAHLALDKGGRLYVADADADYVKILDRNGLVLGRLTFRDEAAGKFNPAALAVDAEGRLLVAGDAGVRRCRLPGGPSSSAEDSVAWGGPCKGLTVDAGGNVIAAGNPLGGVAELPPPVGFVKGGTLISRALDSGIENCLWHKILLDFGGGIPPGTSVKVSTHTSAFELTPADVQGLGEEEWQTGQTNAEDFLVLGEPGRFLWLKLEFKGNGAETPVLRRLKLHFPRQTYLQYLPAVYQADPIGKDFLERFLSIFEATFSSFEETIENVSRYFDPEGVPSGGVPRDFLTWLGRWVDMLFDPGWPEETRRRLLRHSAELYRGRGTPAGLKKLLRLALGADVQILEQFQTRRRLVLTGQTALGERSGLGGGCESDRLRLDEHSRVGEFSLVGTGEPALDPFYAHAHKFSVFVRASLCRTGSQERMLRHLIEQEKPAHTQFRLVKVLPRFRVGVQSTVGLDTQVGAYPRLVLNHCATLGYDALLGSGTPEAGPATFRVGASARAGVNAVVG